MAVTRPAVFNSIDDKEVEFGRPVTEETVRKMIQNCNMLAALAPIGSMIHFNSRQPGVTQFPDPTIYQISNGGEITEATSPLRSIGEDLRFTPDMRNRYVRGAPSLAACGYGGNATVDLSHDHGGITGLTFAPVTANDGNERRSWNANFPGHDHPISSDLSTAEPLDVAHQELAVYLKIN
ncbi:MAG: hypothetical protein EOP09_00265 [Proteobacteria bacterium]|nr:MAG: hypothetical protein EOP09_00265 [Pseudomonadota bacterium]